jgi:hypothetical protein
MPSRSQADLTFWALELWTQQEHPREPGFHLIEWEHDDPCPLNPIHGFRLAGRRCQCRPHGTLVLHVGTPQERRVAIIRDGIPRDGSR